MKIFISADIEGISGIVSEEETFMGRSMYPAACKLMTREVNACVEGALEGGATEVVVNDCHFSGLNIDPEELSPSAELIRGQPSPIMISGLDASFDALFLIGYHARKGTANAILDHTYSSKLVDIRLNGEEIGELGLASAVAGELGVPVALVSGDDKVETEIHTIAPAAEVVVTKKGMERTAARCRSPQIVRQELRAKASAALSRLDAMNPYLIAPPLRLEVSFLYTTSADQAVNIPGVERTAGRSIAVTLDSAEAVARLLKVLTHLV